MKRFIKVRMKSKTWYSGLLKIAGNFIFLKNNMLTIKHSYKKDGCFQESKTKMVDPLLKLSLVHPRGKSGVRGRGMS